MAWKNKKTVGFVVAGMIFFSPLLVLGQGAPVEYDTSATTGIASTAQLGGVGAKCDVNPCEENLVCNKLHKTCDVPGCENKSELLSCVDFTGQSGVCHPSRNGSVMVCLEEFDPICSGKMTATECTDTSGRKGFCQASPNGNVFGCYVQEEFGNSASSVDNFLGGPVSPSSYSAGSSNVWNNPDIVGRANSGAANSICNRAGDPCTGTLNGSTFYGTCEDGAGGLRCNGNIGVVIPKNTGLSGDQGQTIQGILQNLILWLIGIFGVLAVAAFIISGIQYLLASGNEELAESAKKNIQYALLGVVVALAAVVIVRAIDMALRAQSFIF